MRSKTVAVASLAAVASADILTVTSTQDVTVTYCQPSVTNCPAKNPGNQWEPITTTNTWASWTTSTSANTWNSWSPVPPKPTNWQNVPNKGGDYIYWIEKDGKKWSTPAWQEWPAYVAKPTNAWVEWVDNSVTKTVAYDWANWNNAPKPTGYNYGYKYEYIYWIDESGKKCSTAAWGEWDNKTPKPTGAWVEWVDNTVTKTITYDWSNWNNAPAPTGSYVYWVDNNGQKCSTPAWQEWDNKTPKPTNAWVEWVDSNGKTSTSAWSGWQNVPAKPTPVADQWNSWSNGGAKVTACGKYTASGAPEWFKSLPADYASTMASKWANGAPADWCYYSYSTGVPAKTYATGASWSNVDVKPTPTGPGNAQWSNVAKYTGAANANSGSLAMAGLAGLAAIIMA